ncbi:MAG TPA: hypothetical protein VLY23_17940 [Candidatus Acidoferrum sp.]|nr:hypothetical protein [Candidatus Acidoferrum sp.]
MKALFVGAIVYCVVSVVLLFVLSIRREVREDRESQLGEDENTSPAQNESRATNKTDELSRKAAPAKRAA